MGGKKQAKAAERDARMAREQEALRQGQIRGGTNRVNDIFNSQFNDGYFGGIQQSYMDYANPQLEDQYAKAQKDLTFALDRAGTLDSSIRADKFAELQKQYDLNRQQISDQALGFGNQARTSVEDARAGLIAQLNATGDATGAANAALSRSSALSQPMAFSPLASMFGDITAGLGQQAQLERNAAAGGAGGRYSTGLFAPNGSSVVVR